jgi:pilus assembly protein Flp/PilA
MFTLPGDQQPSPEIRVKPVFGFCTKEEIMQSGFSKFVGTLRRLIQQEHGQDLVEYALVVALIAFGATAGMKILATGLNGSFSNISKTVGSYVS